MPDQTPVTDDDRMAHEWAADSSPSWGPLARAAARSIKAHVPAPPAALADELRSAAGEVAGLAIGVQFFTQNKDKAYRRLNALADRAEAVVADRDDAVSDRDEALAWVATLTRERDEAREKLADKLDEVAQLNTEVERLTATFKEPLKEPGHLPDPADVPQGDPYLLTWEGNQWFGLRNDPVDVDEPWQVVALNSGVTEWVGDKSVTLVSRLVPEEEK